MQLKSNYPTGKLPQTTTLEELKIAAEKAFGAKLLSVGIYLYGRERQVEVRVKSNGYHGVTAKRVACYEITDTK